ncbi:recombinase RecA [Candidatus Cyanaurora vandensis]|uniref:recombinase RecA n=1 Tax=Candidatus Cyanaurora vandensis TaxID=2714958 RepID=UPI00257980E8|nr:recombinase RecA [Candidatus Cyanaurora vandensis]
MARSNSNGASSKAAAPQDDKQKALQAVLGQIKKTFGEGSIMRLGDNTQMRVETVPSGALTLDIALGGGIPRGRVIEIYGPESSGKTTLALHIVAEVQKRGGTAAFVDAEHALDPVYAAALGVDTDNLLIAQPDTGESALEIVDQLVRSAAVEVIVIDSVAALVPRAEIEGEMGDSHVGLQARLMSQALRKITANVSRTNCIVIFLNQLRQKIGVMYGNPETTTGGQALKFYASLRLDIRRVESLKKGQEEYGNRVRVKVVKNKVAPPFRKAEFDLIFGKGISSVGCVLDLAVETDIIERRGAWYMCEGERYQGRENLLIALTENLPLVAELDRRVREKLAVGAQVSPLAVAKLSSDELEDADLDADFAMDE